MKNLSTTLIACVLGCVAYGPHAAASREKVLYSFCSQQGCADGFVPTSGVTDVDGTLYGTTLANVGTVFSFNLKTGALKTLHSFGGKSDGMGPVGSLINVNGTLYGATQSGGTGTCSIDGTVYGCGTVYSINPKTGAEAVVYSFQYNRADGIEPEAGLIPVNGALYGTTYFGGSGTGCNSVYYGCGTVFSFNPASGAETVVHSFEANGTDGTSPDAGLTNVNGLLYGTTFYGGVGSCNCGTVFSYNLQTGTEAVLYSFSGMPDGTFPSSALTNVGGTLYGATAYGGSNCLDDTIPGCGIVYSVNPDTGAEKVVYSFCSQARCTDGADPAGDLTSVEDSLYGLALGGKHSHGVVFSLDLKSNVEKALYSFHGRYGEYPSGKLANIKGALYGTTEDGGIKNYECGRERCGTIFSLDR